jgi:hypothetical protein
MTSPNTVTVPALQFASLLAPVMPLASKDVTFPILNAVLIELRGPYLVAIATDRYRVGIKRTKVLGDGDFRALIRVADLRRILAIFKSPKRGDTDLRLTVEGNSVTVEAIGLLGVNEARMSWSLVDGDYPKVEKILAEAITKKPANLTDPIAVNADYLAEFRHAATSAEPLRMWTVEADSKPGHDYAKVCVQGRRRLPGPAHDHPPVRGLHALGPRRRRLVRPARRQPASRGRSSLMRAWAYLTSACAALVAWWGGTRRGRAQLTALADRHTQNEAAVDQLVSRLDRADGVGRTRPGTARVVPLHRVPAPAGEADPTTLAGIAGIDRNVYVQTHRGRAMWVCGNRHPLGLTAEQAYDIAESGRARVDHVRWVDTSEPDWLRVLHVEARAHRLLCGPNRAPAPAAGDHTDPAA